MSPVHKRALIPFLVTVILLLSSCGDGPREIERPEKIVSKREVVYDTETYVKLAKLWEEYYRRFPSEDAYANWMYASRYAGLPDYESLLDKGLKKYPANPVILYLSAMKKHGAHDNLEAQHLLDKATKLDPSYMDPWFALVIHYMDRGDGENLDVALRRLLDGGVIQDEVMDHSYNMFALLNKNAILVTNGDNDTYPGWILTRILKYRPDVSIVNRSLLNTDWYPIYLVKTGLPNFITQSRLDSLRKNILAAIESKSMPMPPAGPFSDTLVVRLIEASVREGRPVYFAATLFRSDMVDRYRKKGQNFGLVTLVTPSSEAYRVQLKRALSAWLREFRTAGLDSWTLRHAKEARAGRQLATNYAAALHSLMESIIQYAPEYRLDLFRWYQDHMMGLVPQENVDEMNKVWCRSQDVKEIRDWCRKQNYID